MQILELHGITKTDNHMRKTKELRNLNNVTTLTCIVTTCVANTSNIQATLRAGDEKQCQH